MAGRGKTTSVKVIRLKDPKSRMRFSTWNVGTLTGKHGEIAEVLLRRMVDVCCVQETRWLGGKADKRLFEKGDWKKEAGVGVAVANEWCDNVVEVKRMNDRMIVVKLT
ncbi:hypothetical protein HET73_07245 [Wolbachia endosymbiont of Atemnus politus]|nr:hypothetical protein [Wolbachia endosymbiont of Atemnus politus]